MTNYDYLYKKEYYGESLYKHYEVKKELGYQLIKNGVILPYKRTEKGPGGGVIDGKGEFIGSTSLHNCCGCRYDFPKIEKHEGAAVIYLGMFHGIWGHCLTDNIRRLWFLKSSAYIEKFSQCRLVFVPMEDFKFEESNRKLLEILGFCADDFLPVTGITQFDTIILPDESFFTPDGDLRYFTEEYRAMIDQVRDYAREHRRAAPYKKVYFSYRNYTHFKQFGEERLEQYFHSKGYKVLYPEKLTFEEQLNVLINCDCFASTIGSCSHNILFLRDRANVILIPRANYLTGYQITLDQVHDLDITYIDATLSLFAARCPWEGPFYYFVSSRLMDYFKDERKKDRKYWAKSFKGFKMYAVHGLNYGRGANAKAYQYYSDTAAACLDQFNRASRWTRVKRVMMKALIFMGRRLEILKLPKAKGLGRQIRRHG